MQDKLKGSSTTDTVSLDNSETTKNEVISDDETNKSKEEAKERVVLCGEVVSMKKMKDDDPAKKTAMAASLWVKEKVT